jgi:hypothetical protein
MDQSSISATIHADSFGTDQALVDSLNCRNLVSAGRIGHVESFSEGV